MYGVYVYSYFVSSSLMLLIFVHSEQITFLYILFILQFVYYTQHIHTHTQNLAVAVTFFISSSLTPFLPLSVYLTRSLSPSLCSSLSVSLSLSLSFALSLYLLLSLSLVSSLLLKHIAMLSLNANFGSVDRTLL